MPGLNHKGPEGKGHKTGRKLGLCNVQAFEIKYQYGEGMGMRRRSPDCKEPGKRIHSSNIINK